MTSPDLKVTKHHTAAAIVLLNLFAMRREIDPGELLTITTMAALEMCASQRGTAGAVDYFRDVADIAERQALADAGCPSSEHLAQLAG